MREKNQSNENWLHGNGITPRYYKNTGEVRTVMWLVFHLMTRAGDDTDLDLQKKRSLDSGLLKWFSNFNFKDPQNV